MASYYSRVKQSVREATAAVMDFQDTLVRADDLSEEEKLQEAIAATADLRGRQKVWAESVCLNLIASKK
jgi:hypothetical protein